MASNPVSDAVADAAGKAAESIPSPARFYLAQTLIVLGFATFALWHTGKSNRNFDAIMDRMVSKEDFQAFEKKMDEATSSTTSG